MTIKMSRAWLGMLASVLLCAVLPGSLCAQAASSAKDTPPPAAAAATAPKSADTTGAAGKPHDDSFIIGVDDVLAVNVWKEPDVSRSVPVRSDGKISLPLVGEVQASGQTPKQLEVEIARKLQNYISEPDVTVIVTEIKSQKFNILGQVAKPGTYRLTSPITVLDAIALAGGFRDFAKRKSIYVLRQNADGTQTRLPFNYKDVVQGKHLEQNVQLVAHDTIVVP